ncbi:type I 3-dehydroquinate dehydratase [Candidatus Pacearchaeota archaeon]|nr:type I 3-dehydroquinate dehydratase [Candidatus Pacearchaeota archaeon]
MDKPQLRLVIPITASTMDEAYEDLESLPRAFLDLQQLYTLLAIKRRSKVSSIKYLYEWRADAIQDDSLNIGTFAAVASDLGLEGIFTSRHPSECVNPPLFRFIRDEAYRKELYEKAVATGFAWIDREAKHWFELDLRKTRSIVSYHAFDEVPSLRCLHDIIESMMNKSPDVFKLVFPAVGEGVHRRSEVKIHAHKLGIENKLVSILLGPEGSFSRIDLENYFAYTPLSIRKASAPGQLSAQDTIAACFE